jgi:hypothetical protein
MAMEKEAEQQKRADEEELKEAVEQARRKAREEGKDEDEAAAEVANAIKKKHRESDKQAAMRAMAAAKAVSDDLKQASKGANKLDTGLHPHGDKWWRYRYEHSYVEAIVMIFVSWLLLVWSEIWRRTKKYVHDISLPRGELPKDEFQDAFEEAHGTIMISWIHCFADQMLVCILVYLTVWVFAKTEIVNYFPHFIKASDDIRVPATGEEYRRLAIDIVTIFNFAIAFYFLLMYAVAHAIRLTTSELEMVDDAVKQKKVHSVAAESDFVSRAQTAVARTLGASTGGTLIDSRETFAKTKANFVGSITAMLAQRDEKELKEISTILNDDFNNFPLSQYLKVNVRIIGLQLFLFSWTMWLPQICLFFCLLLLHRYEHVGYIRVMIAATVLMLVMIAVMSYATKKYTANMKRGDVTARDADGNVIVKKQHTLHENHNTEGIFLGVLEFALFFICYGIARFICQSWMWELHFWPVLSLTIAAIICALLFVVIVAPAIPTFLCVMSLPPYLDPTNMAIMKICSVEHMKQKQKDGPDK